MDIGSPTNPKHTVGISVISLRDTRLYVPPEISSSQHLVGEMAQVVFEVCPEGVAHPHSFARFPGGGAESANRLGIRLEWTFGGQQWGVWCTKSVQSWGQWTGTSTVLQFPNTQALGFMDALTNAESGERIDGRFPVLACQVPPNQETGRGTLFEKVITERKYRIVRTSLPYLCKLI